MNQSKTTHVIMYDFLYKIRYKKHPHVSFKGNITKSGLLNYYKEYWRCENQDPRVTLTTNYQDTFLTPTKEYLKRWAIPLYN